MIAFLPLFFGLLEHFSQNITEPKTTVADAPPFFDSPVVADGKRIA